MKKVSPISLDSFKKALSYGDRIHPARDWYTLVIISSVLLLLGIVWNIFLFNQVENGKSLASAPVPQHQEIQGSITSVQAVFQKRATQEDEYQQTYHFVDPSLPGS